MVCTVCIFEEDTLYMVPHLVGIELSANGTDGKMAVQMNAERKMGVTAVVDVPM